MTVLVALYNATDGTNWKNSTNWLSDRPISDWHGVVTDRDGRVIRLILESNRLTGEIPTELGNLSNLEHLNLGNSWLDWEDTAGAGQPFQPGGTGSRERRFEGPIPPVLGNLSNLEILILSSNELTGPIPPELGDLSYLRALAHRQESIDRVDTARIR